MQNFPHELRYKGLKMTEIIINERILEYYWVYNCI